MWGCFNENPDFCRQAYSVFRTGQRPQGDKGIPGSPGYGLNDCLIPLQDARSLGYNAYFEPMTREGRGTTGISKTDIFETDEVVLEEVSVGNLVAKDVKAMAYELPKWSGIEGVMGLSFLQHFNTQINFKEGYLDIEPLS